MAIQAALAYMGLGQGTFGQGISRQLMGPRIQDYLRYRQLYRGFLVRQNTAGSNQYKPLRYNLARPICDISSDFLASRGVQFAVAGDDAATKAAERIWTLSGGNDEFMQTAMLGAQCGDACGVICKRSAEDTACIRWLDPSVCYPEFDPHDYNSIVALTVAYWLPAMQGQSSQLYSEEWRGGKVTYRTGEQITREDSFDELRYGGVPAVWIRNLAVKGQLYGDSDLQPVSELIEKYDHLSEKADQYTDYNAYPNMYTKGMKKGENNFEKGLRNVYHLPADGEIGFIESKADPLAETRLQAIREAICEVSETPAVAFSRFDSRFPGDITGVALRLLYNPLLAKTERKQKSWGCGLQKLLWLALNAENIRTLDRHAVSVVWPDPLPSNKTEEVTTAQARVDLGVSRKQALKELGYTDEQIAQFEKDNAADQQATAELGRQVLKQFNQGKQTGGAYPPTDMNGQMNNGGQK